ncbi:hypothetical protein [Rhodococcus gannanensis]|uniref:Transposase IS116/IS110/IS902 family protein n=1 Tax=Rhodococcus gannanensis TaxID=1960308 RepID=A0ABW4P619_9NOCA
MEREFDTEDAASRLKAFLPETQADAMRKNVALDIVGDLRRTRFQIEDITARIKTELAASGTRLLKIPGVGIVTAAKILAEPGTRPGSRPRPRSRTTAAPHRSRWPAQTGSGTACPDPGTAP